MSSLGDIVHSLAAVNALKKGVPSLEIHWVVEEPYVELLSGHKQLKRILAFPKGRLVAALKKGRFREAARLFSGFVEELRRTDYDVVLDLQGLMKSALVVLLSRAKRKVGFSNAREGSSWVLNEKIPPYDPEEHAVKRYLSAVRWLGVETEGVEFSVPEHEDPEGLAKRLKLPPPPWIVFVPGTRWESKTWTEEGWKSLSRLVRNAGRPLLWIGSRGDRRLVERVALYGENLCGRISLRELWGILSGAEAVVSVDTGPMHMASALQKPVIALFGPTSPSRTGPLSRGSVVIQKELECVPCFRKSCKSRACMKEIQPEEVFSVLQGMLG